jgi:hypothetical protein
MFLGLWHPTLRQLLSDWISIGPAGDIAQFQGHFASFHDIQVIMILCLPWWSLIHLQHNSWHPYAIMTNLSHQALTAEMLYCAIIGPLSLNHPELKAFSDGFSMPCQNSFTVPDVSFAAILLRWSYEIRNNPDYLIFSWWFQHLVPGLPSDQYYLA